MPGHPRFQMIRSWLHMLASLGYIPLSLHSRFIRLRFVIAHLRSDIPYTVVFHRPLSDLPLQPSLRLYKGGSSQPITTQCGSVPRVLPVSLSTYVCPRTFSSLLNVDGITPSAVTYSVCSQYNHHYTIIVRNALVALCSICRSVHACIVCSLHLSPQSFSMSATIPIVAHNIRACSHVMPRPSAKGTLPLATYRIHLSSPVKSQSA